MQLGFTTAANLTFGLLNGELFLCLKGEKKQSGVIPDLKPTVRFFSLWSACRIGVTFSRFSVQRRQVLGESEERITRVFPWT